MMLIATIDGGTTNTRVRIWRRGEGGVFFSVSEAVSETGVRNTAIDGNNQKLLAAVGGLLRQAEAEARRFVGGEGPGNASLPQQGEPEAAYSGNGDDTVSLILASGMLTSNLGIAEIPHIAAPADLPALAQAMVSRRIPELENKMIWFIPGIKNRPEAELNEETLSRMDMMRGEETEAAGLLTALPDPAEPESPQLADAVAADGRQGYRILVLPGSHNKYIAVDAAGRICGCFTTLAGELLRALTLDSILAGSLANGFAAEFEAAAFLRGADWGRQTGVGHGAFLCRICDLFAHYSPLQAQNYLLGLLLSDDLAALEKDPLFAPALADKRTCFMVAGRSVMQQAYGCLLERAGFQVKAAPAELQGTLSGKGALALARLRGLI